MCSIQHYVIRFVSDLRQVGGFLLVLRFSPPVKLTATIQGRIQDLKLGGTHLKKLRRAEGGAKIFGVFRVKNHDFTQKNQIFSKCRGKRENCWGISCEKITILLQKILFFPILGGRAPPLRYNWNIVESGVKHHKPNQAFVKWYGLCRWFQYASTMSTITYKRVIGVYQQIKHTC